MGRSEPLRFTVLGRGLDPEAVLAFADAVEERLTFAEARAEIITALADAGDIRRTAAEEVTRIRLQAYSAVTAIHEEAMAEVEMLDRSCRRMRRLVDAIQQVVLAPRRGDDAIHFVVEPEALVDRVPRH